MAFTIIKGHVFHPSSREKFEKDSCLFWLIMAGSIAGILFGALFIILAVL